MSLTDFVNPIYRNYAHAVDQRDGPRVERIETADWRVIFRRITPYKCENLGEIHFAERTPQSLFDWDAAVRSYHLVHPQRRHCFLAPPLMSGAFNRLPAIGQSSAPMTEGCLLVRIFATLLRAITNNTDNKCVYRRQRNSLCNFRPVFVKDRQPCCVKRIRGDVYSPSAAGEQAHAPECQQITASSSKPPRGEPEFRSTTDCPAASGHCGQPIPCSAIQ